MSSRPTGSFPYANNRQSRQIEPPVKRLKREATVILTEGAPGRLHLERRAGDFVAELIVHTSALQGGLDIVDTQAAPERIDSDGI